MPGLHCLHALHAPSATTSKFCAWFFSSRLVCAADQDYLEAFEADTCGLRCLLKCDVYQQGPCMFSAHYSSIVSKVFQTACQDAAVQQCPHGDPDCRPTKDRTSQNNAYYSLLGPDRCTVEFKQEYATLARDYHEAYS